MFPNVKPSSTSASSADFEIVRAGSGLKRKRPKGSPKHRMVAVPLLGIHAGTIGQAGSQFADLDTALAEEMIAAPAFWCPNPVQTTCLRVKGTSMSPLINDGDIVAVDASQTDPKALNGKIIVAWHRENGLALARFVLAEGVHLLESENREYSPVTMDKSRKWQIVGRVLWWIRKGP
jgi:SOS-response transcriptional repressor LexA